MRGIDVLNASQAEAQRVTAELLHRLPNARRGASKAAIENLSAILHAYAREARVAGTAAGGDAASLYTAAGDKAASLPKDTVTNLVKEAAKGSMFMARDRSSEQALARAIAGTAASGADDRILSLKDVGKKVMDAKSGPLAFKSLGKDFALGVVYNYLQKHPSDKVAVLGLLLEGGVSVATSLSGGPVAVAFSLAFVIDKAVNELGERWVRSVEQDFERQFTDTVLQLYLKIHADTKADLDRETQILQRATIAGILEHDTNYFKRGFGEMGKLLVMQSDGSAAINDFTRQEAARLGHNLHIFIGLTIKRFAYAAAAAWMAEQTSLVMARHYGEAAQLCAELANTASVARAHEELTKRMNEMLHSPGYKGVMKLPERSNIFRAWSREYDQYREQFMALRLRIVNDLNVFVIAVAEAVSH